jgi:O-Antigen ligase
VLAAVSLVVLGRLVATPGSVPLAVAATGLLTGLAATMSRAGVLALVVGLVVLAGLRGLRVTARAVVGPLAGAVVAMLGLLPSMPAAGPPRPALALVGLGAGLALAAMVARPRWLAVVLTGGLLVAAVAGVVASREGVDAGQTVAQARVNLASSDRTGALHAALGLVAQHPLTGTGPGQADLRWKGPDHGSQLYAYVHNEYLQVATELGLVGLVLLAVLLVTITRMLWRARPTGQASATRVGVVAAVAAFAVHSGFDFVWHLPAIVLTVTLLVGLVLPAPDPAPAHQPSIPVRAKDPNENQAH